MSGLATELYYRDGAVLIWPLQLAILQGLLDRPGGASISRDDCTRAALPHAARARGGTPSWWVVYYAIPRLVHRGWVSRRREGRCIRFALTPRGRAIVNGEVVVRVRGGELHLPGRRLPSRDGSPQGTAVSLGWGIDLVVPPTWLTDNPAVTDAVRDGRRTANGSLPAPGKDGVLLTLTPAGHDGRIRVVLMLLPTGMSQEQCAALSNSAIAALDAGTIRPEAEAAAASAGYRVDHWNGTTRGTLGGRHGLVTRYLVTHADGHRLMNETHVAYLGAWQLVAHLVLPAAPRTPLEDEARQIPGSLRIAGTSL